LAHNTHVQKKKAQSIPFKRKLSCDEKKKPEGSSPNTRFLQQFAQKHESFTYKKHCLKKLAKKMTIFSHLAQTRLIHIQKIAQNGQKVTIS